MATSHASDGHGCFSPKCLLHTFGDSVKYPFKGLPAGTMKCTPTLAFGHTASSASDEEGARKP